MSDDGSKLKLFVVGELPGDPAEWDELGSRTLVLAEDEARARELAGNLCRPISLVSSSSPCVVIRQEVYV
jgi:hypothetical protein